MPERKQTGGTWDKADWPRYFIAGSLSWVRRGSQFAKDVLVAVNEVNTDENIQTIEAMIASGCNVFLDSGVFNLANQHAVTHKITMDEALSLAPERIDGFDELLDRYVMLCNRFGDRIWGAVEIDQGGLHNKRRTRARLEALGLRPIPVYHPFNDGWDYFDELAQVYDRICFGNVVQAPPETRRRLVATAWQRRSAYPDLWIHLLGMTPSPTTVCFPANSCDSSTWLQALRWGQMPATFMAGNIWSTGNKFLYEAGSDVLSTKGSGRSCDVSAYSAHMTGRLMRRVIDDQRTELGYQP